MTVSRGKSWDFEPEPNEMSRRIAARTRAREVDVLATLTDDEKYARTHEALRRASELLVDCVDDLLDRAHRQAVRDQNKDPMDIAALYVDERAFHRARVARILVEEALEKANKANGSQED